MIVFSLIFTRACLVFPAAASGHSLGLRSAWRKLRGNTWRLITAIFVLTIAYIAIASIPTLTFNAEAFSSIISGTRPKIALLPIPLSITIELFSQIMLFISLTLSSSIAGIFYREIVLRPAAVAEVFA